MNEYEVGEKVVVTFESNRDFTRGELAEIVSPRIEHKLFTDSKHIIEGYELKFKDRRKKNRKVMSTRIRSRSELSGDFAFYKEPTVLVGLVNVEVIEHEQPILPNPIQW